MNMDDVIATIGRKDYEIDQEHTEGSVTFTELKYENVSMDRKVYADEQSDMFPSHQRSWITSCVFHSP